MILLDQPATLYAPPPQETLSISCRFHKSPKATATAVLQGVCELFKNLDQG